MSERIQNDEFLTKRELARLCRCSERTIDRLIEGGDAPPLTRLSTRRIIFPASAARQWLSNRTLGLGRQTPQSTTAANYKANETDPAAKAKSSKQHKAPRASMSDKQEPAT
jgi:predicted DNA-binding transcriptional regulator AlpA